MPFSVIGERSGGRLMKQMRPERVHGECLVLNDGFCEGNERLMTVLYG